MISRFEEVFVQTNRALIGVLMAAMFGLVFTNVTTRYGFGFSISWSEEISRFLMIWVTFLGAGLGLREGRHVAIDIFQEQLSPAARGALRAALAGLILIFLGLLIFYGIQLVNFGMDKVTIATQIPRGIPFIAVPLGAAFFAIHLLLTFGRFVRRDWDELQPGDPQDMEG